MGYLGKLRVTHLGKIFSNFSVAATVVAILCALSSTITALAVVFGVMLIVLLLVGSCGLLYVLWPGCIDAIHNLASASEILPFLMQAFLPSLIVAIVTSILSLICLRADPEKASKGRIGFEIGVLVVLGLLLLAIVFQVIPITGVE